MRSTIYNGNDIKAFSKIIANYIDIDDNDIEPFEMNQLKRPVIFVLTLYGMAMMVLLIEYVIYKWKDWRDRESFSSELTSNCFIPFFFVEYKLYR